MSAKRSTKKPEEKAAKVDKTKWNVRVTDAMGKALPKDSKSFASKADAVAYAGEVYKASGNGKTKSTYIEAPTRD